MYAETIARTLVRQWCPLTWEAFEDYRLHAITLSRQEQLVIRLLLTHNETEALRVAQNNGWLNDSLMPIPNSTERQDAEQKLQALGLSPPWRERQLG